MIQKYIDTREYEVFLFGSQAKGTAHERSDIDIGIYGKSPLSALQKANLIDAFRDTPYHIDLVDFATVSPEFRKLSSRNKISWTNPK